MKKSIKSFLSLLLVLVVALPVFIMAGCGQSDNQSNNQTPGEQTKTNYALQRVECGYIANNNSGYYELYNILALTISTDSNKDILKYQTNLPREAQSSTIILSSGAQEFYALHSNSNNFIDSDKPTFKINMRYVYKNGSEVELISERISIDLEMNSLNKYGEAFATATSTKDGVERKYNFTFYFVEV